MPGKRKNVQSKSIIACLDSDGEDGTGNAVVNKRHTEQQQEQEVETAGIDHYSLLGG